MSAEFVAVQTTTDSRALAESIASSAVDARLAACVQISEITSVYRWGGAVEHDAEQLLTLKTTAEAVPALRELVHHEHPYDEPEFIVLAILDGSTSYLDWIRRSVEVPHDPRG